MYTTAMNPHILNYHNQHKFKEKIQFKPILKC